MGTSTKGNVILTSFGIDVFMASFFSVSCLGLFAFDFLRHILCRSSQDDTALATEVTDSE